MGSAHTDRDQNSILEQTLGGYRIVRKIAQGGMGAVYEAVHSTLGRRAAVKVLLRELLSNEESADRFFNEAIAISKVSHPCLVTIYEHGTSPPPESRAYIVMEYLDGEPLRARAEKQYLGGSALEIMRQLASALSATHKKRIIHRDLKPDNIMLVRDDTVAGGIRAKILDFGIAKLLPDLSSDENASDERRSVRTRTGALIGTPAYMSPEQCRAAGPPDEKTDVYSLGTIGFEILYGEPPFMSESAGELYALHMFAPPPDLRQRVPGIDRRLGTLINRMLAKKPTDRPNMDEVLHELHAVHASGLSDGAIEARPSSRQALRGQRESSDALQAIGSNSSMIRRQMIAQTTTNASSGEQMLLVPPQRGKKVLAVLGGAGLALLLSGFSLLILLRPHSPRGALPSQPGISSPQVIAPTYPVVTAPPASPSSASAPASVTAPPTPPPSTTTPPAPDKPTAANSTTPAAPSAPLRKEKTPRKGPHGSKAEKYQIDLWK